MWSGLLPLLRLSLRSRTSGAPRAFYLAARLLARLWLPIAANQRVRRAVVLEVRLRRGLQLRNDVLRQHLAQLDAPLIERIDAPDRALREHTVQIGRAHV